MALFCCLCTVQKCLIANSWLLLQSISFSNSSTLNFCWSKIWSEKIEAPEYYVVKITKIGMSMVKSTHILLHVHVYLFIRFTSYAHYSKQVSLFYNSGRYVMWVLFYNSGRYFMWVLFYKLERQVCQYLYLINMIVITFIKFKYGIPQQYTTNSITGLNLQYKEMFTIFIDR